MNDTYRPSNGEIRNRAVHRLTAAVQFQRKQLSEFPIQRDFFAESEAIACWPFVVSAYHLIEQSFKCLLELRGIEHPRRGFKGHRIYEELFRRFNDSDKAAIRGSYIAYRSLHDYIPPSTSDDFLSSIGTSYNSWRYFLLEGCEVPTTHLGAMIEIAYVTTDLLCADVFTDHGIHTIDRRLRFSISHLLCHKAWIKCLRDLSLNIGAEETKDMNDWLRGYNNMIDAFADLIRHDHAKSLESIEVLPSTREILTQAIRIARGDRDQDMQHFLLRAGNIDRPLLWSATDGVFKQ